MILIYKLLVGCCLLYYGSVNGQHVTKNIQHKHEYKIGKTVTVEIENKYGNIDVTNWDKDSVKIIVEISLTAKNQDKLDRLVKYTNVDFIQSSDYISVKTRLGTSKLTTGISVKMDDSFGASDITVKYTVFVPSTANLEIKNSFGDIFLHSRTGLTNIELAHGNLRATVLTNDLKLEATYSKIKIKQAKKLDLKIKHCSTVDLKKVDNLKLNSSYSSIEIGEVGELRLESKKDKIDIDKVATLYGSCSLPNVYIEYLSDQINLTSRMVGVIEINEVASSFSRVEINTSYSSLVVNFAPSDFTLKLTHKDTAFTYPTSKGKLNTVDSTTQKHTKITTGNFGKSSTKKRVTILSEDSDISFTFNQ
jgi:hypothetical protein